MRRQKLLKISYLLTAISFFSAAFAASSLPRPIYSEPKPSRINNIQDFVARDQDLIGIMNFEPGEVETRKQQIQALEQDLQTMQGKSKEAMTVGVNLLNLHVQQAMYLENLRGLDISDKRFPDIDHFAKVSRRNATSVARKLLADYPQSPYSRKWKITEIESLMRAGDSSAYEEAVKFGKKYPNTPEAARIKALGIALTAIKKSAANYGSLQSALSLQLDGHTSAVIKLLAAEANFAKNKTLALKLYQEAAREGLGIKKPSGGTGPITIWAASRVLNLVLYSKPKEISPEIVSFLQELGLNDHLKFYYERCAQNNLPQSVQNALENYDSILNVGNLQDAERIRIGKQTLEISIQSKNLSIIEERWKSYAKFQDRIQTKESYGTAIETQTLAYDNFKKKNTPANAEQFIRLHDFFVKNISLYSNEDSWKIKALEVLTAAKQFEEVSGRSDRLAKETKQRPVKLAALRYSARAKEQLIGVTEAPKFSGSNELKGGNGLAFAYIDVLNDLQPLVSGAEKERGAFQRAYLTHTLKSKEEGKEVFFKTISANSKSTIAPAAASYILSDSVSEKDYAYTERLGRNFEKLNIKPADKRFQNLRNVIEVAVFEQGKSLAEKGRNAEAADKFVAFQAEFPKSKNADQALHLASRNYTQAKQVEKSIKQMEKLLKDYPNSPLAKETMWAAAEQSKSIGQLLRAATHYANFATTYPAQGLERRAWFLAAELHKSLGRFSHAIASYEQYMNSTPNLDQKILVAREIAAMQHKYGSAPEALASYDRVIKISGRKPDEVWARYQMLEILLRQGLDLEARGVSKKLLAISVSDKESLTYQAKARFTLGKIDAANLAKAEPMRDANLVNSIQNLLKTYGQVKQDLISPCEVPGLEWCSVGYYEAAKMAENLATKLLTVKPPPTIDPALAQKVTNLVKLETDKLATESKAYADQAETALSTGAPDSETAELIRAYSQRVKGRDNSDLPE